MSLSYVRYVADGTTDEFDVPFDFVNRTHVKVTIDGVPPVLPIRWAGENRIKIADRIAAGSIVELRRVTPISERLVDFQNGSVLTEEELDTALNQIFFLQQELRDQASDTLGGGLAGLAANEEAIDNILQQVLSAEAATQLSNAVSDIAVQGSALSQQALNLSVLRGDHEGLVAVVDALTGTDPGAGVATLIQQETNARIAGDNALASDIALIGARSGDNLSFILDTGTLRVSPTESLAQRLSALTAADGVNAAAIVTESSARASADSALASSITALTSTVDGNSATITSLQQTLNGVSARYGVSLDVNGYVTGFVQNNNGTSGDFTILADRFSVVDPNGGLPITPFEVSGGSVFIREAFIDSLNVARLTSGALGADIVQNGDWNVGTGRIVWDNGTYMKVAGVGFGTSGQFIEWFGPKTAINLCSEANAISYLKTNGDAYFGGTLSAGTLRNAAQTSDIGASASVAVGPFGTNGSPIQIVTSYSIQSGFTNTYPATTTGRNNWEAAVTAWGATAQGGPTDRSVNASKSISCNVVVRLDRNGSQGWATLTITSGTETLVGTAPVAGDTEGYLTQTRTITGSITSTDNLGGTTDRTFVATITTRTNATIGAVQFQRVGIVATEE